MTATETPPARRPTALPDRLADPDKLALLVNAVGLLAQKGKTDAAAELVRDELAEVYAAGWMAGHKAGCRAVTELL